MEKIIDIAQTPATGKEKRAVKPDTTANRETRPAESMFGICIMCGFPKIACICHLLRL